MEEDFAELSNDKNIVNKLKHFNQGLKEIESILKICTNEALHEKLTNLEKIKVNTLLSFSLNSLFWMHLRAEGIDPANHEINQENDRLKKIMIRAQELKLSKKPTPRVDTDVAKRFIRSSLWTPQNNEDNEENVDQSMEDDNNDNEFEIVGSNSENM